MAKRVPANKKWYRESILMEAKKYASKSEWMKNSMGSYLAAKRTGVFKEASRHMTALQKNWTKNAILSDAKKFRNRSQWRNSSYGAYEAAKRIGLFEVATRHMAPVKEPWDPKEIARIAKTFDSITTWAKGHRLSLNAARRLGIYEKLSKGMKRTIRTWTNEDLIAEGRKFKTRAEWAKNSGSSYQIAYRRGLMPIAGKHLRETGNRYFRQIYVIQHLESKSCYVGLSYDALKRYEQHVSEKSKQRVDKTLREYYLAGMLTLEVLDGKFPRAEAKKKEAEIIQKYKAEGWTVLNTAKAGALGSSDRIHTLKSCLELAKNCKSRTEYSEMYPSAYNAVVMRGWVRKVFANIPSLVPDHYTKKAVREAASKCKSRAEFMHRFKRHYNAASRFGILDKITKHMGRGTTHAIKDDKIIRAASACKTVQEFKRRYPVEYGAARRRGIDYFRRVAGQLKKMRVNRITKEAAIGAMQMCKSRMEFAKKHKAPYKFLIRHFPQILDQALPRATHEKWTLGTCKVDASNWNTEKDWRENSSGAYTAARKNKWLDECTKHMNKLKRRNGILTLDYCRRDALKYETRGEWRKASASAYQKAFTSKWLEECCKHMKVARRRSASYS